METVLITGGAGFIGSNFVRWHLREHPQAKVINLDKLTYAGNLANLSDIASDPRYRFVQGDICDAKLVHELMREVTRVVHFAAETHVDRSILAAGDFLTTDVMGTFALLEAARAAGNIRRFVHISTDEVYGNADDGPSREDSPLNPRSPYAASKTGADRLAFACWCTHGLPVVITRCSNNFGPYQYPEKLIPFFVTNALLGETLPLYGSGLNIRDWIHVDDHCAAVDFLLYADGVDGEVFNVGAGCEKSNREIADIIISELGADPALLKSVPDRAGHVLRHAVTSAKLQARGWRPQHTNFRAALAATIRWYRDNETWWRAIREKSAEYRRFKQEYYQNRK